METNEWQFDGIVGPTHNYAGLAVGNLAAANNKGLVSNPRNAALQGLEKMRFVQSLGMNQAFLPPHYRPAIGALRQIGLSGDLKTILNAAPPHILSAVYSSSFMWAANAATVTLYTDDTQNMLHFTPANLISHFHRSLEAGFQKGSLGSIFHNKKLFSIHNALDSVDELSDEGAANHALIYDENSNLSTHLFVYGKSYKITTSPMKYPARQHRFASESVARQHGLKNENCLFFQQSPAAIDAGVFHNDVIAMSTTSRMIVHENAYIPEHQNLLRAFFAQRPNLRLREVAEAQLSLANAVSTYLFNSQMLELPNGKFYLIAPYECKDHSQAQRLLVSLQEEGILDAVYYNDVRESMRNGGGPACLRLRVVMTPQQSYAMHQGVILTDIAYLKLKEWINKYYRDRLSFDDFRDHELINELDAAYGAFETLVGMPGLYDGFRS